MKQVLLYGTSIFLAGLAAHLKATPDVQVACRENLVGGLDLAGLDAVVVDLNDVPAADLLALLRAWPELRIVGVNTANNALTVLSGRVVLAQTVDDVVSWLSHAPAGC